MHNYAHTAHPFSHTLLTESDRCNGTSHLWKSRNRKSSSWPSPPLFQLNVRCVCVKREIQPWNAAMHHHIIYYYSRLLSGAILMPLNEPLPHAWQLRVTIHSLNAVARKKNRNLFHMVLHSRQPRRTSAHTHTQMCASKRFLFFVSRSSFIQSAEE